MHDKIEKIAELIYKNIIGYINKSERQELDVWRNESEENRILFAKMSDSDFLKKEYFRRKSVETEKALASMKRRIESSDSLPCQRKRNLKLLYNLGLVAASILLLVVLTMTLYYYQKEDYEVEAVEAQSPITYGKTQAVLTLENGLFVEFGKDSLKNMERFKQLLMSGEQCHTVQNTTHTGQYTPHILTLSTPHGGEFNFILDDGTEVWLNAESQLVYPEKFVGNERRVVLSGEAYFKVAKNAAKPFVVESAGQEVYVTGTEFNIHNYAEEPYVYTTLVSGSVLLKSVDTELVLTSGLQAVYNKVNCHTEVQSVDINVVTCWKNGRFVFDDQTLEQIMCTLSRWYDFTYEFKNNEVKSTLFMGTVPRYGQFSDVARILEASGGLYFKMEGKKVEIFRK